MKDFAANQWRRALKTFASAEQLVNTDPDSAASRAYYAAFYAITALFGLREQTFTKHSALRAAVHRELIQTGQWPQELGQAYDFLLDMREIGDYGGIEQVSQEDAEMAIEKASSIIKAVADICPELGKSVGR
jgi:hypothetical protein